MSSERMHLNFGQRALATAMAAAVLMGGINALLQVLRMVLGSR